MDSLPARILPISTILLILASVFVPIARTQTARTQTARTQSAGTQTSGSRSAERSLVLKSPAEYLGYELGDRFTRHAEIIRYVEHVSQNSERVEMLSYGETTEGRKLVVVFVSSPSNLARLTQIREDNLRLAGLADGPVEGSPVSIVWLSYNVHGNEAVSSEAAMATLFKLADSSNSTAQQWLENTVVIIDPMINPDGRDRYVNWYNQMVGTARNVNPDAIEHREPFPGGRTNHYYFDLNRDWVWLTQQESRARVALYQEWMPHVHVDFHEQSVNSPYYFAPGAEPFHEVITPWQREFQTIIGRNHARYFDENGWLYFTKQVFDLFYPGYGDTFPTYNGAVGMTYEQGGGGRAGLGITTALGDTLTLADRIAHHYTTGLSTVEMASVHRDRVVAEFQTYFDQAQNEPAGDYATYIIKRDAGGQRVAALQAHLDLLGIRHGSVSESRKASGFSYRTGENVEFSVDPGDLVIEAHQPRSTLLSVLFEPETAISDSVTYDITAWSLPYVYDVNAYATDSRISTDTASATASGQLASASDRPYAYLVRWRDAADVRFLSALLRAEIRVRFAEKPFTIEGASYAAGTLIITRTGNEKHSDRLHEMISALAQKYHEQVTGVRTGFVDSGSDFGSGDVNYIKPPKVAVLRGAPVSSSGTGEIWHYFDQQIEYPVTMILASSFASLDLNKYEVLVLPGGSYGSILSDETLKKVRAWISKGGRLIAIGSAGAFLAGKEGFALKQKKKEEDKSSGEDKDGDDKKEDDNKESDKTEEEEAKEDKKLLRRYADRRREGVEDDVPGAIYRVSVDNSHPLGFGFEDESFVLKRGAAVPSYLEGSGNWNVGVLKKSAHVSGQVGHKVVEKLDRSLAFGVQNMGSGTVVYIVDDPLFRGFWYSGRQLLGNAVFLVGQ